MKVTRYPQSCLLIEDNGRSIVIDPGDDFLKTHQIEELDTVEAVLYTHRHADHLEPEIVAHLADKGVEMYANGESAEMLGDERVRVVEDNESFEVAGFRVIARELPHCLMPDGSEGPQNTGYIINGALFHPGDGKELEDLRVDNLAMPITGPDVSMRDAFAFARQVGAEVAIPIHYDKIGATPEVYKHFAATWDMPFEVRVLADGESTEL